MYGVCMGYFCSLLVRCLYYIIILKAYSYLCASCLADKFMGHRLDDSGSCLTYTYMTFMYYVGMKGCLPVCLCRYLVIKVTINKLYRQRLVVRTETAAIRYSPAEMRHSQAAVNHSPAALVECDSTNNRRYQGSVSPIIA